MRPACVWFGIFSLKWTEDGPCLFFFKSLLIKGVSSSCSLSCRLISLRHLVGSHVPLKRCAPFLASSITYLFNLSLTTCSFPSAWKLAKVIPLYKNRGSQSDPSNYRPISLLPAIGKVMDDIQSSRLLSFLTTNKLISPHQFGFVPRSSTVHQLVYIIDKWTRTRDTGSNFSATFMDFMKAFDRVWHTGLLYKLAQCGISSSSLAWIQDLLIQQIHHCTS